MNLPHLSVSNSSGPDEPASSLTSKEPCERNDGRPGPLTERRAAPAHAKTSSKMVYNGISVQIFAYSSHCAARCRRWLLRRAGRRKRRAERGTKRRRDAWLPLREGARRRQNPQDAPVTCVYEKDLTRQRGMRRQENASIDTKSFEALHATGRAKVPDE